MKLFTIASLTFLGVLATASSALAVTFSNSAPIAVPAAGTSGPASPYPSTIAVSGVSGTTTRVTVTLHGVTHTYPDDLDVLLVDPTGTARVLVMSDACGPISISGLELTFDESAAAPLPDAGPCTGGTYASSNWGTAAESDLFSSPAPGGPYTGNLATFNGLDPNGTWSLYVMDDLPGDVGSISGGWSIDISTTTLAARMRSFTAVPGARGAVVRWRTASELGVVGFNVWRDGARINRRIVVAQGRAAGYRYVDRTARPGRHSYRLQLVNLDGSRSWYGRATATAR